MTVCACGCGLVPKMGQWRKGHNVRLDRAPALVRLLEGLRVGDGCWEWQHYRRRNGYGSFTINNRNILVHRFAYEVLVGPIPVGLQIDHLCRNRACARPDHLQPVTMRENIMRGTGVGVLNAAKTHCKHGHEFTSGNTAITPRGSRTCRACGRARMAASRKRQALSGGS